MFLAKRQKIVYNCSTSVSYILSIYLKLLLKKKEYQLPSVFKNQIERTIFANLLPRMCFVGKNKRWKITEKIRRERNFRPWYCISHMVIARLDKRIVPVNLISGIKRIPFYIDRYSIITLRMLAERYKDESVSSDDSKTEFPSPIANRASRREQVCHQFFQSLSLCLPISFAPFFFPFLLTFGNEKESAHSLNRGDILFSLFFLSSRSIESIYDN